jgi:hypothetical protein
VLRLLAALGVLEEHAGHSFSATIVGERLRTAAPAGMRSWATFLEVLGGVRPFAHILQTLKTGRSGREIEFGVELFASIAEDPNAQAIFNAAMSERTAAYAPSVADRCDFADARRVVDVGGGNGTLLVEILRRNADAILDATDIADRCEVLAGDFFERIPEGADRYVLANVIHDWDDAHAIEILSNCRRSIATSGRVLIVERLIPDDGGDAVPTLLSDINMLVLTGGRERTNAEYGELLASAGLKLGTVLPVAFPYGVIEGLAA